MSERGSYNKFDNANGTHGTLIENWVEERALKELTGQSRAGSLTPKDWIDVRLSGMRTAHQVSEDAECPKSIMQTSYTPFPESDYKRDKTFFMKVEHEEHIKNQGKVQFRIGNPNLIDPERFQTSYSKGYNDPTFIPVETDTMEVKVAPTPKPVGQDYLPEGFSTSNAKFTKQNSALQNKPHSEFVKTNSKLLYGY